jgi:hypothetical protein
MPAQPYSPDKAGRVARYGPEAAMEQTSDRRKLGEARVPIQTLVEICGNEPGSMAFEAETIDVSGRGMQVRTAYLPEVGEPLVCRFEDGGREIVAEGMVAWRNEQARGGEFGIAFTALDANSVEALRKLCGDDPKSDESTAANAPHEEETPGAGGKVRLHIEGLGSPMKARVRDANRRQVEVGSNLGFLRVGRHLEIESPDRAEAKRHGATIESVKVSVDPQTQVPELVVTLRFDSALDSTPEPSVIDSGQNEDEADDEDLDAPAVSAREADVAHTDQAEAGDDDASVLRGRFGVAAIAAGGAMKTTGAALARAGAGAAVGLGQTLRAVSAKMLELRKRRSGQERVRRTAPPPSSAMSIEGRRLRPQSQKSAPSEEGSSTKLRRLQKKPIAIAGAITILVATICAIAMRGPSAEPVAEPKQAAEKSASDPKSAAAEAPAVKAAAPSDPASMAGKGVSADVPLFGPTPMATMEPAPLGPAPDEAAAAASEEAAELSAAAAAPRVQDESFPDDASTPRHTASNKKVAPGSVAPWGRGRVHNPTIHRLRLDEAGQAIQGVVQPTGFTVLIPGRKVMEAGKQISKRDERIARVRTNNGSSGAQVTFEFRDGVPAYRVRLRKDYVEFLISAADPKAAPAPQKKERSRKTSRSTSHHDSDAPPKRSKTDDKSDDE